MFYKCKVPLDPRSLRCKIDERVRFYDWHEILILKECDHDNIVKLLNYGVDTNKNFFVLCFERHSIPRNVNKRKCFDDILEALIYLHEKEICHRDITKENILMDTEKYILCDYGRAINYGDDKYLTFPENDHCFGRRVLAKNNKIIFKYPPKYYFNFKSKDSYPLDFYFDLRSLRIVTKQFHFLTELNFEESFSSTELYLFFAKHLKKFSHDIK